MTTSRRHHHYEGGKKNGHMNLILSTSQAAAAGHEGRKAVYDRPRERKKQKSAETLQGGPTLSQSFKHTEKMKPLRPSSNCDKYE